MWERVLVISCFFGDYIQKAAETASHDTLSFPGPPPQELPFAAVSRGFPQGIFFYQGHPFTEDVHSGSVGMGDISGTSKLGQQLSHVVLCLLGEGGAWCLPPPGGTVSVQSESCQHLEAWVDFWSICLSFPASVPSSYTESRGGTSWHLYNLWTFLRKTGEKSEHKLGRKTNLYLGFKFLESEKSRAVLWNLFNFPEMLMKTCFQATWLFLST